jgi:hypothetical protein
MEQLNSRNTKPKSKEQLAFPPLIRRNNSNNYNHFHLQMYTTLLLLLLGSPIILSSYTTLIHIEIMDRIVEEFLRERYCVDVKLFATQVIENENVVCRTCRKPILLGAVFHYRGMYFHISCLNNVPTNHKALLFHFGFRTRHGPFIFTEEVKNDCKEDVNVVCFGCEKPVSGAEYKCSTSHCNLLLHKSCLDLPPQVQQHPFHHPNHTLSLVKPQKKYCNACGKSCNAYPFYHCSECDFNLDTLCATRLQINNIDGCQHSFISLFNQIQFICQACGEEGKDLSFLCSICQLLIHGKCARFPHIIKIPSHDHSLTLTYSLRQVKKHTGLFCKLYYQRVKAKYATYYCQECNYVAHLACAFKYEENVYFKLLPEESEDLATNVMEVERAGQIRHFSHQHDLILSNEEMSCLYS